MEKNPQRQILSLLETFSPDGDEDRFALDILRGFVLTHTSILHRANLQGHLTASAFIVDPPGEQFLLIHHRKLDKWVQPGGHADGDADLYRVAAREAWEETGLRSLRGVNRRVFDLDIHTIPAWGAIPAHLHYDVRFLFVADRQETLRPNEDECLAAAWIRQEESAGQEESVRRMALKVMGHLR